MTAVIVCYTIYWKDVDSDSVKEPLSPFLKIAADCYLLRVKYLCVLFNLHTVETLREILKKVSGAHELTFENVCLC